MKEFPQLVLCFLVGVVITTKAQTNPSDTCYEDLRLQYYKTGCRDNDAWIECLQKMIKEKKSEPFQGLTLEHQLEYFKHRRSEDLPCPLLEDKGSCVHKEMNLCHRDNPVSLADHCNKILGMIGCLTVLNETCSNIDLVNTIQSSIRIKESCESGNRKWRMEMERCYNEVTDCTKEFLDLYKNKKNYEEARKKVDSATECLDKITCDDDGSVKSERFSLELFMTRYKSGILTGKCSFTAIVTCYNLFDSERRKNPFCTKEDAKKARDCLKGLKPHCNTKLQVRYYDNFMKRIDTTYCLADV